GIWQVGEMDFGCGGHYREWVEQSPEHREKLALWIENMAKMVREKKGPFMESMKVGPK
ncbi:unnamed protein product, partial [marine sediment metagenome]